MFKNKKILITGGTGSFGKAFLKKILQMEFDEVRIFSRDEKKQDDMRNEINSLKIKFYIGDVRDYYSIDYALKGVDYVFHAAALKQVPSCEFYPMEAVKTNINGTENVLNSAIDNKVKKVIFLSTDKAVYPVNAMGISKAMAEKQVVAKSRSLKYKNDTILCTTRYGNVLASRGSVIPLFIRQIKENKPLTITDPDMTRFLMTLDEAIDLVIYTFKNGRQGETFVQKSAAASVGNVAEALLKMFNAKNKIKIIGTRHSEKKHEVLLNREELAKAIESDNYYRVLPDDRDLNYNLYFNKGEEKISLEHDYSSENTKLLSLQEIIDVLKSLDIVKKELADYKSNK
ncbi:MAG: polysaccharide biosynthesis protein [Spirochaetia bacterium]|nr:polysaccharide biosynthesis protein [Spirochaetia bacterium]